MSGRDPRYGVPLEREMLFPGRGLPQTGHSGSPTPANVQSDWYRLAHGKPLGKKTVVPFEYHAGVNIPSPLSALQIVGDDDAACQLSLMLAPPRFLDSPLNPNIINTDAQNISGTVLNDNFTGVLDNPFAEIIWGVGGGEDSVKADILNGLALNLTASYVRVRVGVDEVGADTGSKYYETSCFIGPGYPKANNAQYTQTNIGWQANLSPVFATPRHAKSVSLVGFDNAIDTLFNGWIAFYRDRAQTFPVCSYFSAANNPVEFPIPNGGYFYQIKRTSIGSVYAQAVFQLSV